MARQSKKLKEPQVPEMDAMLLEEQVDPVSGNTAPLGALPAEVRDDIDILVSPGEFVINAATVRYFGQEFFDSLQDTAEDGWERIASTGDLPFRDDELEFEEGDDAPKVGFDEGDIVEEGDGLGDAFNVPDPVGGGYGGYGGTRVSSGYDFKTYSNEAGKEVRVYFYNGRPLSTIPEGYEEGGVEEGGTTPAAIVASSANNDDNKWARQAGLSSGASNKEILSLMNENKGYWNTTPDTWVSSDWANYNKSINNSIKIGNFDLKMNLIETIVTGVAGAATGGLGGLALGAQIKAGKKKQAEATYKLATEYMDYGMYGGADPRTVIDAAFSAGRLLGKIDEGTDFKTWYKTTAMAKGDITKGIPGIKLPEVNQSKMSEVRPTNPNAATAWQEGLNGEQLYNAMTLHVSSLNRGTSATSAQGYVVGVVGGKGREGMLADAEGKVVRYSPEGTNMSYPVYMDANGKQYVYTGFFSQVKEEIPSGQEVDYKDPNPSGLESSSVRPTSSPFRTSTSYDDDGDAGDDYTNPEDRDDPYYDPMEDLGVTPESYANAPPIKVLDPSTTTTDITQGDGLRPGSGGNNSQANDNIEERKQPGGDLYKATQEVEKATEETESIQETIDSGDYDEGMAPTQGQDKEFAMNKGGLVPRPKKKKK